jgi:GTP 3',8-cyclase
MLNQVIDRHNRVHDYLRISLTDRCNLNCSYCMPDVPYFLPNHQLLTDEELLKIVEIFAKDLGIQKIRLTGGEPLVRKNAEKIIESLSHLPVELAITTNGVLLDRFFPLFEKIGLKSLNISLDSLMPENFKEVTKSDLFYKVFENINHALAKGFHVKINTVVKRGMNEHEIMDFIEWTRNSPVHVRFIEFMPFDGNRWLWDKVVSFKEMLDKIETGYSIEKLEDGFHSTAKSYRVNDFQGTFAVISTVTEPFCQNCNRMRLTADGKMRNCLFSQNEIDLLSPFRKGEDIRPLIQDCITKKEAERGGLNAFDKKDAKEVYSQGRCMTSIGG